MYLESQRDSIESDNFVSKSSNWHSLNLLSNKRERKRERRKEKETTSRDCPDLKVDKRRI